MTNKETVFSLIELRKYLENCDDDNLVFNAEPFDKAVQALNILDEIKRCIWDNSLYMKSDIGLATNFEFQILELLDEYNGGSENGNDVLR